METYPLPCVKQTASVNLLHDSGSSKWGSVTTWKEGMGWERGGGSRERVHMYTYGRFMLMYGRKVKVKSLSRVQLFATPWTVAYQVPLLMGFSGQECWSGLPFPSPGDVPDPGIEPSFLHCRQMLYHLSHQGNGLLFPPPGDLPNPGIEPTSPVSPALAGGFFTTMSPGKPCQDRWDITINL